MPAPGTRSIAATMSAIFDCPDARSAATACAFVEPRGRCMLTEPANTASTALPSTFGATTFMTTAVTLSASTAMTRSRCGFSSPMRRRADAPKFSDFSAGAIAAP